MIHDAHLFRLYICFQVKIKHAYLTSSLYLSYDTPLFHSPITNHIVYLHGLFSSISSHFPSCDRLYINESRREEIRFLLHVITCCFCFLPGLFKSPHPGSKLPRDGPLSLYAASYDRQRFQGNSPARSRRQGCGPSPFQGSRRPTHQLPQLEGNSTLAFTRRCVALDEVHTYLCSHVKIDSTRFINQRQLHNYPSYGNRI